jgi:hypothetical protein
LPWLATFYAGFELGLLLGLRKARRTLVEAAKPRQKGRWEPVFFVGADSGGEKVWTLEDTRTHQAGGPRWQGPDAEAEAAAAARQLNEDFG